MALGPDLVRGSHRGAEGTASTFGAPGAAAALAGLDETGMRYAISHAAQQVSGLWSWVKDRDHIEKAFDFAGMGAPDGVTAASFGLVYFTVFRMRLVDSGSRCRPRACRSRCAAGAAGQARRLFDEPAGPADPAEPA